MLSEEEAQEVLDTLASVVDCVEGIIEDVEEAGITYDIPECIDEAQTLIRRYNDGRARRIPVLTVLQRLLWRLYHHDYTTAMSDDYSVAARGEASHSRLNAYLQTLKEGRTEEWCNMIDAIACYFASRGWDNLTRDGERGQKEGGFPIELVCLPKESARG